jgi:hypothetical protein
MLNSLFYFSLICLGTFLFVVWFMSGRKGGYGEPTALDLRKGEKLKKTLILPGDSPEQTESFQAPTFRDVTPVLNDDKTPVMLSTPSPPPLGPLPQAFFVYNGHDWDAFEVLGVSPYSSFSEITKSYQVMIRKADNGKHDFLQAAYSAILKKF